MKTHLNKGKAIIKQQLKHKSKAKLIWRREGDCLGLLAARKNVVLLAWTCWVAKATRRTCQNPLEPDKAPPCGSHLQSLIFLI